MSTTGSSPEIGSSVTAGGIRTNVHVVGSGRPILLLHGSGPGVSAWANWRLVIPELAGDFRVIAPDVVGYGFTDRPEGIRYDLDVWIRHVVDLLDALGLDTVGVVGNSFGGALALHLAHRHPARVSRLVLMGAVGVPFPLTPGLDRAWGYEPSVERMRELLDTFAFDRSRVNDELAMLRYQASIRPGVQEAYASMFPAPRQRWIDQLALGEEKLATLPHEVLVIHGREDRIIPVESSVRTAMAIPRSQLHVFGRCGHWTQIEQGPRFVALVRSFFSEPPAP